MNPKLEGSLGSLKIPGRVALFPSFSMGLPDKSDHEEYAEVENRDFKVIFRSTYGYN